MAGTFLSPISGKVRVNQTFGVENSAYAAGHHTGLDFGVSAGTGVMAVMEGRVVKSAYDSKSYGNYIVIEHPNGMTTLYAHLSSRNYPQGATVKAGTVLGFSGNTGNSSGPHLHFELRQGTASSGGGAYKNAIDPLAYFNESALRSMTSTSSEIYRAINNALNIKPVSTPTYQGANPGARGASTSTATSSGGGGGDGGGGGPNVTVYDNRSGGSGGGATVSDKPLTAQDFGFSSAFLKANPSINSLVEQAIANNWSVAQLQGRVIDDPWYKARTKAQREYDMNLAADPKTIADAEAKMLTELTRMAKVMGVSTANLAAEAKNAVRNGMAAEEYIGFLSTRASYSAEQVGRAGIIQQQVLGYADAYGITASPDEINRIMRDSLSAGAEWAGKAESYEDHFRERAKVMYKGVAKQIDAGATVKDILDPYLSRAADMLGTPKETMSTANGQWNRAITGDVPMSLQEWEKQVRTDSTYRWDKGPQALEWARSVGDEFMKAFGARS